MGKLTVAQIRALKEPGRYSDGDGLILEFTRPGRAYWFVRVQHNGRRRDIGLGPVDEITLAKARDKAHEARKSLAKGIDPTIERQKAKLKIPTFREAAKLVHEEHKAAWKNGKHQDQWITTLTTYAFPRIGNRLVSDIEGPVIRDVLAPIWLSKPETARRVRQRIGVVLDWSYAKGFRTTEAPLRSISRGLPRQPKRDRHLAALPFEDVPAFLLRVREKTTIARLALEFLILAAARSGEVRGMRWPEIDLAKRVWTVPADRMKAPVGVRRKQRIDRADDEEQVALCLGRREQGGPVELGNDEATEQPGDAHLARSGKFPESLEQLGSDVTGEVVTLQHGEQPFS